MTSEIWYLLFNKELLGTAAKVNVNDICDLKTATAQGKFKNVQVLDLVVWRYTRYLSCCPTQDEDELQQGLSKIDFF